jgi:hypothetical protein
LLEQVPLWLVEPPEGVGILSAKRRGERPYLVGWPRPSAPSPGAIATRRRRRIVRWGGPWKVTDVSALTAEVPLRRDYYQIETEDGGAYLVYWDRRAGAWYLQGVFD